MPLRRLAALLMTLAAALPWLTLVVPVQRWDRTNHVSTLSSFLGAPWLVALLAATVVAAVMSWLPRGWWVGLALLVGSGWVVLGSLLPGTTLISDARIPEGASPPVAEYSTPWLGQWLWLLAGLLAVGAGIARLLAGRREQQLQRDPLDDDYSMLPADMVAEDVDEAPGATAAR